LICAALCCCRIAEAETNSAVLAVPSLQLRLGPDFQKVLQPMGEKNNSQMESRQLLIDPEFSRLQIAETKISPTLEFSASSRLTQHEIQVYRRLDEAGYLTRPEPETPLSHFLDSTFSPEVIHLGKGKAVAGCTIYTAIKRKNPLCLLNPMVLFFSW
jgi:hypothetical protein